MQKFLTSRLIGIAHLGIFLLAGSVHASGNDFVAKPSAKNQAIADQLAGYYWDMEAAFDPSGGQQNDWFVDEAPATRLIFGRAGQVYSQNTCNSLGWDYTTNGPTTIKFKPSSGVTTMVACHEEITLRQQRMRAQMPKVQRYELKLSADNTGQRLTLFLADGERWQFKGLPTPETRYASPGHRIELEIALNLVSCPQEASQQCMRVRQVRWDRNTKTCLGDWQVLTDGIEGYKHTPGRQEIISVQVFPADNRMKGASKFAYVMQGLQVSVIPGIKQLPDCL